MKEMMKKLLCAALCLTMVLSLGACAGKTEIEEPDNDVLRDDVQGHLEEVMDMEDVEIQAFEKKSSEEDDGELEVVCVAYYTSADNEEEIKGTFTLTYVLEDDEWELDDSKAELDEPKEDKDEEEEEPKDDEEEEEPKDDEEEEEPKDEDEAEAVATEVSDDWKEFTFELDGKVYQLPAAYNQFKVNGWQIDTDSYADIKSEEDTLAAYSYSYAYLTNGLEDITVYFINMGGNTKKAGECNIGGIEIAANDLVEFSIAGGLTPLATEEEIKTAFGTPTSYNDSESSTTLTYEVGDYVEMEFYIYKENKKYNDIELKNYVATAADASEVSEERPDYLDDYEAPSVLGVDMTKTEFMLDGKLYQLPCPLDEFLDDGWTISSNSVDTLGSGRTSYSSSTTLSKDGLKISVGLTNFAEVEVLGQNCAVTEVDFDEYYLKNAPEDFLYFPSWVSMKSEADTIKTLCSGWDFYDGSSYDSYSYDNDDYTVDITYYCMSEGGVEASLENTNWDY